MLHLFCSPLAFVVITPTPRSASTTRHPDTLIRGTALTYSHTVSTTGTYRILFVNVKTSVNTSVSSVAYHGTTLTLI